MKCMCLNNRGFIKSEGTEMEKIGEPYYSNNILYQKYICPICKKTRVKILNGFTSKGGFKGC